MERGQLRQRPLDNLSFRIVCCLNRRAQGHNSLYPLEDTSRILARHCDLVLDLAELPQNSRASLLLAEFGYCLSHTLDVRREAAPARLHDPVPVAREIIQYVFGVISSIVPALIGTSSRDF